MPLDAPVDEIVIDRPRPEIFPRRFRFDGDDGGRAWLGGDPAISALWDAFSVFLPCGERFFVRSVRQYKDLVTDPQLRHEVDAFVAQEAQHSGAHVQWNNRLAGLGYDVAHLEAPAAAVLKMVTTRRTPITQIAVTCALEHITAIIADLLLGNPSLLAKADRRLANLWFWHALEETEHKAVAFDVMTVVLRDRSRWWRYRVRARVFLETMVLFNAVLLLNFYRLTSVWPWPRRVGLWAKLGWYLLGWPGIYRRCAFKYFSYLRPGFHPWQDDNRAAMERWRAVFPPSGALGG